MLYMADSITAGEVVRLSKRMRLDAVAGYIDGDPSWRSFYPLSARFYGKAHCVSITTQGGDASMLDFETGDWPLTAGEPLALAIAKCKAWIDAQLARGRWRPIVYANLSTWSSGLLAALAVYGRRIRRVVADYDGRAVIPAGFDGKQYIDRGPDGENVDLYVLRSDFFPAPAPKPRPRPVVHPKVTAGVVAGALGAAVLAMLQAHGVHVTHLDATERSLIAVAAGGIAAHLR